jgi:hypothetical protein
MNADVQELITSPQQKTVKLSQNFNNVKRLSIDQQRVRRQRNKSTNFATIQHQIENRAEVDFGFHRVLNHLSEVNSQK